MNTLYLSGVSVQELETKIEQIVRRCLDGTNKTEQRTLPLESNYLTRKQTASLLGVSLVTLHKWSIEGVIPSYRISSRIRYKQNEIEEALLQVKSLKYNRFEKE
jgi:excisionase family DNA binding protein